MMTIDIAACNTLDGCFMFLFQLSLLDSTGWSFLDDVLQLRNKSNLNILIILYVLITSVILLNGLKGLFGFVFMNTDKQIIDAETVLLDTAERRNRIKEDLAEFEEILSTLISRRKELCRELRVVLLKVKFEKAAYALSSSPQLLSLYDVSTLVEIESIIERMDGGELESSAAGDRVYLSNEKLKLLNDILSEASVRKEDKVVAVQDLFESVENAVNV